MTIIVGISTPDGVILASENRTTQAVGGRRILSDSAQKVFEIGRFGVATTGEAFIGENTIAGLMDQFVAQLEDADSQDVGAFADALGRFFDERFIAWVEKQLDEQAQAESDEEIADADADDDEDDEHDEDDEEDEDDEDDAVWDPESLGYPLRFLVAGYDADGIGHIHEVLIPGPERGDYSPNTTERGTIWRGQTDVITRMLKGVDRARLFATIEELSDEARKLIDDSFGALEHVHLVPITVQDGIDYASFLIRTTIDMQRFSDGTLGTPGEVPGCGGPLQILVVERSRTVWAAKPELRVA